jgi:hypothetical protein
MMASLTLSSFPPSSPVSSREPPTIAAGLPGVNAAELLAALSRIAERLATFQLCDDATAPAILSDAAIKLGDELGRVLEMLRVIERLNETVGDEAGFSFGDDEDPETRPRLVLARPAAPRVADVCFAGTFELNRARVGLNRARSAEDQLVAAETALRGSRTADLRSALDVRRLYAQFRHALRRPEGNDAQAVLMALRYAAGALATLIASPPYARARASDRSLLRRLQERMLDWSRRGRDVELGLQLLDDVWTSADLLRDVNRRQELRAHDSALIAALLGAEDHVVLNRFGELTPLLGLDDELDLLIERGTGPSNAGSARALLERLR